MKLTRSQIFDRIHRAGVISMLALTGFGAVILSLRTYRYFTGEWLSMSRCLAQRLRVYLNLPCGLVLVVMVLVLGCGCWLFPFTVLVFGLLLLSPFSSFWHPSHSILPCLQNCINDLLLQTVPVRPQSHIKFFFLSFAPPPPHPPPFLLHSFCWLQHMCVHTSVCWCVGVLVCGGVRKILFYIYYYL